MSELSGLYAIWEREFRIFLRERSRIVASAINPLLWLFIFGEGLGSQLSVGGLGYQTFLFPGILVMTVLFSSIFYGAYIVWDKRLDFLKEVLVAPISRTTIFLGKVLGGATDGLLQVTILMFFAPLFGVPVGAGLLVAYAFLFIVIVGLVSLGLIIGSLMDSPEGFGLISSFINFPLFFLSGALFPLNNLPSWLAAFTSANPVSYGVDAVREVMLGSYAFGLVLDLSVLLLFALALMALGTVSFKRMKL